MSRCFAKRNNLPSSHFLLCTDGVERDLSTPSKGFTLGRQDTHKHKHNARLEKNTCCTYEQFFALCRNAGLCMHCTCTHTCTWPCTHVAPGSVLGHYGVHVCMHMSSKPSAFFCVCIHRRALRQIDMHAIIHAQTAS